MADMMSDDMRREQERERHMQEEWSTFEQEEKERVEREQRADVSHAPFAFAICVHRFALQFWLSQE